LGQLAGQVDAGSADPEQVQDALRTALRDPGLVVAYRALDGGALLDLDGRGVVEAETSVPVRVRGEEIGAIVPSAVRVKRPSAAIARAAAGLVDAARMRAELRRATAEVEASRERILRAGDEERRRLERDLHDGAQQRLVALGMRLRVLQRTSAPDAETAATLDKAVAELGTAVAELRQLAHGVRPSALDDGLAAALADLTRLAPAAIHLDVEAAELPDLVATTAYFVVSEAVTNALRHAGATRIQVRVHHREGMLRVRVDDDGIGGAAPKPAGGLTGIADRVDALGGRMRVTSIASRGTTVEARIPCGS
ncbi:sensor histidine kinase, partial [Propionicimonas sp.]|uniref:sensor histidine kinase n=1 Tax=Propionicimonas sp. TaxID=1955623 RepID=UPI0039E23150